VTAAPLGFEAAAHEKKQQLTGKNQQLMIWRGSTRGFEARVTTR
jgi:hypothetical protein